VYKELGYQSIDSASVSISKYQKLFDQLIQADGIDSSGSKFLAVEDKGGMLWSDIVLGVLAEEKADYVLLNPAIHLGNVVQDNVTMRICTDIIKKCECNVVVCNH
jgi:hypothetical protein